MNAIQMWNQFVTESEIEETEYEAWTFGDAPDELADLVLRGIKTGTSSAYPLYELENEFLPQVGEYSVILNSREEAVCVIKTIKVEILPFGEVKEIHAYKEGEGDKSLNYWRKVHKDFFESCMKAAGMSFDEDMLVVFEEFEVVYKGEKVTMLETKDLFIKQAEQKDWKDMYYNLWCHAESAKYMLWNVTTSEEDAQIRMEKTIAFEKTHPYCWLVYEKVSGQAIGFAGMEEIEPGVYEDMGIALGPDFVGKGYGKQIVKAMVDYAKNELSAKKMVLSARSQNIASKKLQESCGFLYSHSEDRVDPRTGENYVLEFTYKEF